MRYAIPLVIILLALLGASSIYVVTQGHAAIVTDFGHVETGQAGPGLHFRLPFLQRVSMYDTRTMVLQSEPEDCKTRDGQPVRAEYFARWKITAPATFHAATGDDALQANQQIASVLGAALCSRIAGLDMSSLLTVGQDRIDSGLLDDATSRELGRLGVTVSRVGLERVLPPDAGLAAVYKRMSADAQRQADAARAQSEAEAAAIRAKGDADNEQLLAAADQTAATIRGDGDAEAAKIYAAASARDPQFFNYWSSLDTWRNSFGSGDAVVVLDRDSPFMQAIDAGASTYDSTTKKH
jgi:modulator of FtsH protease HflC